jgi:hypothetical protein
MYDQINKYAGEMEPPKPMKEPELVSFYSQFEKERNYMSSLILEARERLQQIYRYSEPSQSMAVPPSEPPADLSTELHRQLGLLREQNAELASLVRHIRQIIG